MRRIIVGTLFLLLAGCVSVSGQGDCLIATIVADSSGNFSATGTWTGDAVPGPDDVAQTGAYTVTIDGNITCTRLEATSSGHFEVTSGGITINANFTMASSYGTNGGIRCTHATGTVTLNGVITPSATTSAHAVGNGGAGTLTITGLGDLTGANALAIRNISTGTVNITATSLTGGTGTNDYVVNNVSSGTLNITANVAGGSGSGASAVYNASTGTITLTGNATGGSNSSSYGIDNTGAGTVNISGTATGGSYADAYGIFNNTTGTVTCDMAVAGSAIGANGIFGKVSGGTTTYKRIGSQTNGNTAIGGFCKMALDVDYNVIVVLDADGNDVSMSNDYPVVTAVLDSVTYNRTTKVGTYHAPAAAEVIDTAVFGAASGTAGTVHLPAAGEVIDTAVFGAASGTAGTFAIPAEADVKDGVFYGAAGTEFEGTLVAGGGGAVGLINGGMISRA